MNLLTDSASLSHVLLADMTAGYSLQQIADDLYARTGMLVIILDLNNHIVLHAQCKSAGRIWDFAMEQGFLPVSAARQPQHPGSQFFAMHETGNGAILEPGEIDDCYHACIPLRAGGGPDGVLAVRFEGREQTQLAAALAKKLGELYEYFAGSGMTDPACRGDFLKTYLARELLLYDNGDRGGLFSEAYPLHSDGEGEISARLQPGFCIAAIRTLDPADSAGELSLAEADLPTFLPQSVCLISRGVLLAAIFGLKECTLTREGRSGLLTQLDIFARKYHLYCGLSSVFGELSQRKNYKHQALDALCLGARSNPVGYLFLADELYTQIVLSEAVKRAGEQILTISDVKLLAEYDAKNKTNYLKTLELYLRCNNRIAAASKAGFVDRGTMKYRLQKIRGLLQVDFDQPRTAKFLRLGIAVYNEANHSAG